jgi:biopolymer transport protein ExbB
MILHGWMRQGFALVCLLFSLAATGQSAKLVEPQSGEAKLVVSEADGVFSVNVGRYGDVSEGLSVIPVGTDTANNPDIAIQKKSGSIELPSDLSAWGMFMQADWVVKAVMIGLALASLVTWTVLVAKTRELRVLVKRQRQTLLVVSEAENLKSAHEKLVEGKGSTELTNAAAKELHLSAGHLADAEGVKERVASNLERLEAASSRKITRGTSILATIGATAPFVGLFGTVWGIMNSFIGISKAQTTNLAVVAPGIAEALLATALGLVAAIPAVVIYNHFARQIAAYKAMIGDTSAAILRLVSRDLSRHSVAVRKAVGEG